MKKYKQYKAVAPEETINRIRTILNKVGILLKETSCENDGLYACRLTINNDGLSVLNIGTNGKGRSYAYALASGYAEFMERLQNGVVYNQASLDFVVNNILTTHDDSSPMKRAIISQGLQHKLSYDVNETLWDNDKVIELFKTDLKQLFNIKAKTNINERIKTLVKEGKTLMVPVYSITEKKEMLYPINLALMATGSNGMCAGNTPIEAILQGLCEIFERYSATQIFFKRLTPPTLDIELFKDTIVYSKMQYLKKHYGYEFIIKDCSLGKGLPVLGLLIIDHKNNTYNFKLGADFIPAIALERCLTEVHQSKDGFIGLSLLNKSPQNNFECYSRVLQNGTGYWPKEIFYQTPSYQFYGFDDSLGTDNYADLKYACKLVSDLGSNLYVRDNSYLGFPSYYIIAPGLSGVCQDTNELHKEILADPLSIVYKHNNTFNIDDHSLNALIQDIEFSLNTKPDFSMNELIPYYANKELKDLDPNLFLCMAYYKIGDYHKSHHHLNQFLNGKNKEYKYYYATLDFITLKYIDHEEDINIESVLCKKYGQTLTDEVIKDMSSPNDIFKYYNFKRHFDWRNMDTNPSSYFLKILSLDTSLKRILLGSKIKQCELDKIFK